MSSEQMYSGRTALVTGSSAGIGLEIARELYSMGVNVVVSSRSLRRCEAACEKIRSETEGNGKLEALEIDLADFNSVREAVARVEEKDMPLSILVLNAGMLYTPDYTGPWLTANNIDVTMASNHYGHFLLTELLLPRLRKHGPSLIVSQGSIGDYYPDLDALFQPGLSWEHIVKDVSPLAEKYGQRPWNKHMDNYHTSKFANTLHAYELQRRLRKEKADISVTPTFPGLVATSIQTADRDAATPKPSGGGGGNPDRAVCNAEGAKSVLYAIKKWAAKDPVPDGFTVSPYWIPGEDCPPELSRQLQIQCEASQKLSFGKMWISKTSPESYDEELALRLWDLSKNVVGLE
jgi:NAD(P)-dependent dehydrogenase (short-subunit alcohol dehydrogenase family)